MLLGPAMAHWSSWLHQIRVDLAIFHRGMATSRYE